MYTKSTRVKVDEFKPTQGIDGNGHFMLELEGPWPEIDKLCDHLRCKLRDQRNLNGPKISMVPSG